MEDDFVRVELEKYKLYELCNVFDLHAQEVHAREVNASVEDKEYYHGNQINLPLAFRTFAEEIIEIKSRLRNAQVII